MLLLIAINMLTPHLPILPASLIHGLSTYLSTTHAIKRIIGMMMINRNNGVASKCQHRKRPIMTLFTNAAIGMWVAYMLYDILPRNKNLL